jgi:hypothetical protein
MRVLSPENWYQRLEKQIAIFQAHMEIKEFDFIARSCKLKPYDIIFTKAKFGLQLYKRWIDEYSNQIVIGKNGKLKIEYNALYEEKYKIVNTDMYYNLSMDKIVKISKFAYIFCGSEDVELTSCIYLCLLGLDNCLRCYVYLYEEWHQVSPLYIGLYNLKFIANHLDIKYFLNIKGNNINLPAHCIAGNGWITSLPVPEAAHKEILLHSNNVLNNIF